jgi:hypothetical protein
MQLARELQELGLDLQIGWIDCDQHGRHLAHFRHSRVAASRSFPQTPGNLAGRNPKVAKVQVHAKRDGIRPKLNVDQIPLPFRR